MDAVRFETEGPVGIVTIDRPEVRNAVDPATASALVGAFERFEADPALAVAVLTGSGGTFCAGFDLKALAGGAVLSIVEDRRSPIGPVRMMLAKPVIAAVEGHAVGGGFELALWCDLRVAASDAVLGVFNRRFGVPLIDGGTIRLPRLVGHGRAMDLILTGRAVTAAEALEIGLVNRVAVPGRALADAVVLGRALSRFPQATMRSDRLSVYEQWSLPLDQAIRNETRRGLEALASGEAQAGAVRFAGGAGRHGSFEP